MIKQKIRGISHAPEPRNPGLTRDRAEAELEMCTSHSLQQGSGAKGGSALGGPAADAPQRQSNYKLCLARLFPSSISTTPRDIVSDAITASICI